MFKSKNENTKKIEVKDGIKTKGKIQKNNDKDIPVNCEDIPVDFSKNKLSKGARQDLDRIFFM